MNSVGGFIGILIFLIVALLAILAIVKKDQNDNMDCDYDEDIDCDIQGDLPKHLDTNGEYYVYDPIDGEKTFIGKNEKYYEDVEGNIWVLV